MGISKLKFKIFLAVLPPEPPPGLCPGSAGGLTAPPPTPQAGLDKHSACHKGLWAKNLLTIWAKNF